MSGFAGLNIKVSKLACLILLTAHACAPASDGAAMVDEPAFSEVSQAVVNGCGTTNLCMAHNVCGIWDQVTPNDGVGYYTQSWVEYAPTYTFRCDDRFGCDDPSLDPCPSYRDQRRAALVASRPGLSAPADAGLNIGIWERNLEYYEEGCGPYDQYCVQNQVLSCDLYINSYPTPYWVAPHECGPCLQFAPVACGPNNAVVGGTAHTCALVNGGVKCWGSNSHGQLGDGSAVAKNFNRVAVSGLTSGVYSISSGGSHTCAIIDGSVKCWGFNSHGQLGNPVATESRVPVGAGALTGVQAIAAGDLHTCAIAGDAAWCWGFNHTGQLGAGSPAPDESVAPLIVSGLTSGVSAITAGGSHSCAVVNGAAKCWGDNMNGQLGNGTAGGPPPPQQSTTPVQVTGLNSGVQGITAGLTHTCALVNGGVKCWGNNATGQLGNGSSGGPPPPTMSFSPVQVTGLTSGVSSVVAGRDHTCAFLTAGGVKCWGGNASSQLGTGSFDPTPVPFPVTVTGLPAGVQAIATGYQHSCALGTSGILCWGSNSSGQLSVNPDDLGQSATPRQIGAFSCSVASGTTQCSGM